MGPSFQKRGRPTGWEPRCQRNGTSWVLSLDRSRSVFSRLAYVLREERLGKSRKGWEGSALEFLINLMCIVTQREVKDDCRRVPWNVQGKRRLRVDIVISTLIQLLKRLIQTRSKLLENRFTLRSYMRNELLLWEIWAFRESGSEKNRIFWA